MAWPHTHNNIQATRRRPGPAPLRGTPWIPAPHRFLRTMPRGLHKQALVSGPTQPRHSSHMFTCSRGRPRLPRLLPCPRCYPTAIDTLVLGTVSPSVPPLAHKSAFVLSNQ